MPKPDPRFTAGLDPSTAGPRIAEYAAMALGANIGAARHDEAEWFAGEVLNHLGDKNLTERMCECAWHAARDTSNLPAGDDQADALATCAWPTLINLAGALSNRNRGHELSQRLTAYFLDVAARRRSLAYQSAPTNPITMARRAAGKLIRPNIPVRPMPHDA